MKIYIPLKFGGSVPHGVLHSIPARHEIIINEEKSESPDEKKIRVANNKFACIQMGISSGDEFFGMMDADIIIHDDGIFEKLQAQLSAMPKWGALTVNSHPGKIIDHFCSRFCVFRAEAAGVLKFKNMQKYHLGVCASIAIEMRQAGWNLGYYKIKDTSFVEHMEGK